jgi:hypothetical protein
LYERSSRIEFQDEVLGALRRFLQLAVPQDEYKTFFKVLQRETLQDAANVGDLSDVEKIATRL